MVIYIKDVLLCQTKPFLRVIEKAKFFTILGSLKKRQKPYLCFSTGCLSTPAVMKILPQP